MNCCLSRLLTGDGIRKTRLHNYKGELVDLGAITYLPRTLFFAVCLKLFGYRPKVPWLGWRAIRHLDALIQKNWRILEFGSGNSSIWLAQRCQFLVSIEHDSSWFTFLKRYFVEKGFGNIDYRLASLESYSTVADYDDGTFDLILIDGLQRDLCAKTALKKVRPDGGHVYLDNSDVCNDEHRIAESLLLQAVGFDPKNIKYFNDFYPGYFGVNQGLLTSIGNNGNKTTTP